MFHKLLVVFVALLLSACQADVIPADTDNTVGVRSQAIVLTMDETSPTDNFREGETIWVWADKSDGSLNDLIKAWKLTADGDGGFNGTEKIWNDSKPINIRSVHGNFTTITANSSSGYSIYTHTVKQQQDDEKSRRESDLLYAEKLDCQAGKTIELRFGHLLTKINVNLLPSESDDSGKGISREEIKGAKVKILGVKTSANIKIDSKEVVVLKDTASIDMGKVDDDTHSSWAVITNQTIAEKKPVFQVELADEGRKKKRSFLFIASQDMNLKAGMEYTFDLCLKNYIKPIPGEVIPWDETEENKVEWNVMMFVPRVEQWEAVEFIHEWNFYTFGPDLIDWEYDDDRGLNVE